MILQEIQAYIKEQGRIEEGVLLRHFHLSSEALNPMISPLLKRGKIHRTLSARGEKLEPLVYYSYHKTASIPMVSVV